MFRIFTFSLLIGLNRRGISGNEPLDINPANIVINIEIISFEKANKQGL